LSHVSMREWRVDLKAVEDILPSVFAIDELAMKGARRYTGAAATGKPMAALVAGAIAFAAII